MFEEDRSRRLKRARQEMLDGSGCSDGIVRVATKLEEVGCLIPLDVFAISRVEGVRKPLISPRNPFIYGMPS